MKLRNFLSWFASSVIAFVIMLLLINIVTGFFVDISMERTLPVIIGAVYDFAQPEAQAQTNATFQSLCQGISTSMPTSGLQQNRPECLAENQEQIKSICAKLNTFPLDQQEQFRDACIALNDGTLQRSCTQSTTLDASLVDLSAGCAELSAGRIQTRDFIVGPLATMLYKSIQSSMTATQNSSDFDAIAQSQHINPQFLRGALAYIQGQDDNSYLAVKIVSLILLFLLWFVVSHDLSDYLRNVSRMFFSAGMLVFGVWLISLIVVVFFAPNTTALLLIISGQQNVAQPSITELLGLLPIVVLELTSDAVLIFAAASICVAFLIYLLRRYYIDTHPQLAAAQASSQSK